jgi:hypothetical protein
VQNVRESFKESAPPIFEPKFSFKPPANEFSESSSPDFTFCEPAPELFTMMFVSLVALLREVSVVTRYIHLDDLGCFYFENRR